VVWSYPDGNSPKHLVDIRSARVLGSKRSGRVDALKRVPLFGGLGRQDLEAVERISREAEFTPGEELIAEGTPGREFFVLLEGEAAVSRAGVEINHLGPGDFFGEIALLSDRPTSASVTTSAPARVLLIAPRDFRQLLENLPLMQMKVIQALADRLPDEYYWES
jgi:CRP/FNR family transcriptional regulator, cyclic AMP receptor protein